MGYGKIKVEFFVQLVGSSIGDKICFYDVGCICKIKLKEMFVGVNF